MTPTTRKLKENLQKDLHKICQHTSDEVHRTLLASGVTPCEDLDYDLVEFLEERIIVEIN